MAGSRCAVGVRPLRLANFGDSGNDFPEDAHALAGMVSRHVVGDHAEERCQRAGAATSARLEEI